MTNRKVMSEAENQEVYELFPPTPSRVTRISKNSMDKNKL